MNKLFTLMIFFLMFYVVGCESQEKKEWKIFSERNTEKAYNTYIQKYPNSVYADSARSRIWINTQKKGTIPALEYYMRKYPNSTYVDSAEKLVNSLMVMRAKFVRVTVAANLNDISDGKIEKMYYGGTLVLNTIDGNRIEAICPNELAKDIKGGQILEVRFDKKLNKYVVTKIVGDSW